MSTGRGKLHHRVPAADTDPATPNDEEPSLMDEQHPPDLPIEPLPPPPQEGLWSGSGPVPSVATGPQEPPRRRGRILIAGLVVVSLLLGGGAAAAFFTMRGSGEQLLSKVPASSDVVFTVYLDPSAGQKANLFRLASRFPALGSEQQLTSSFNGVLDEALASSGLHLGDVSWVGDQVAFVLNVPATLVAQDSTAYAVLIDTDDEGAAEATLQKLRDSSGDTSGNGGPWTDSKIDGVSVSSNSDGAFAVFDGAVVIASSLDEMSNIVATAHGDQPALEGSSSLRSATAGLPDGRLALLYINPKDLVALLGQISADPTADMSTLQAVTGMAMTVSAEPDGVALDMQAVYDPTKLTAEQRARMDRPVHSNPLLSAIPADALAVISAEHLDTTLKAMADRMETTAPEAATTLKKLGISGLLSALDGDVAVEVAPEGSGMQPGGALLLGTKDPAAMQHAFEKLVRGVSSLAEDSVSASGSDFWVVRSSSRWVTRDYHGVKISSFEMQGFPDISYAVVGDQGVIGTSAAQVRRVVDTSQGGPSISSSSAYKDAIASVPSSDGSMWVNIRGIVDQFRQSLPPDQQTAFDHDAMPNLAPLQAFVVGSESDSSHQRVRVFLRIG